MAILESIAAANAAYSVIRTALSNGTETAGLIGAVGKFLGAEEDVKDAINKKKNSPFTAIAGGEQGDWEEFQALEDLRAKRQELESYCRLYAPLALGIGGSNGKPKHVNNGRQLRKQQKKPEKNAWKPWLPQQA